MEEREGEGPAQGCRLWIEGHCGESEQESLATKLGPSALWMLYSTQVMI